MPFIRHNFYEFICFHDFLLFLLFSDAKLKWTTFGAGVLASGQRGNKGWTEIIFCCNRLQKFLTNIKFVCFFSSFFGQFVTWIGLGFCQVWGRVIFSIFYVVKLKCKYLVFVTSTIWTPKANELTWATNMQKFPSAVGTGTSDGWWLVCIRYKAG